MPRQARNIKKNKMYHIMVQGINREYIFKKIKDKRCYINLLREKLGKYNSIVVAYCMMDNHGHFFIYSENDKDILKLLINGSKNEKREPSPILNKIEKIRTEKWSCVTSKMVVPI